MPAYLNASGDVVALSTRTRTLAEAQGVNPDITTIVANPPSGLVSTYAHRVRGVPSYYHRKTSGDGTDISHYSQIDLLNDLRKWRFAQIDTKTRELLQQGFTYSSQTFSLSLEAQIKVASSYAMRVDAGTTYPVEYNTLDDLDKLSLADATAVANFYKSLTSALRAVVDSGTSLKQQIRDATSESAINTVVDSR